MANFLMEGNLDGFVRENGNGNGKIKSLDERLRLLKHLRPKDSLMIEYADKSPDYFHVSSISHEGWVSGTYIDSNGRVDSRSLLLTYLAEINPKVAHYQPLNNSEQ